MQRVFTVTSHLTFFIALKIMQTHGYQSEDCVLLLLRNYRPPERYAERVRRQIATGYNVDEHRGRVFAGLRVGQTRLNVAEFDKQVDAVLGSGEFVFYTPVCSNDIASLMITKPNCTGYYITEDGAASYRSYNPQSFTGLRNVAYRLVLRPLFPRIFAVKNHFIETRHPKFRGCIATSSRCFPLHRQYVEVIGYPFEADNEVPIPDAVLSVDPLYQFVELPVVEQMYARLQQFIISHHRYNRIAYKMHPRFDAESNRANRVAYENLIHHYFPQAYELDAGVILEQLLGSGRCDFYSCNSSVAIYASQVGTRCYNLMPLLRGTPAYEANPIIESITLPVQVSS